MTIEELKLAPEAERAARLLKRQFPSVVFTSGRRGLKEQAHAMASNIFALGNRKWIAQTYLPSEASRKLQVWVDAHPLATSVEAIAAGLLSTLQAMTPEIAGQISKHLSGLAFDVEPVAVAEGSRIKEALKSLPGVVRFLEREGGLVRWHVQF